MAAQSERIIIGDIGGAAVPESAPINAGVVAEDAFRTPEEFASIALRTLSDGSSVKLGDVARVELGANSYAFFSRCNGQTATGMAIKMAPGSNAVETMGLLKAKMDELSRDFPPGVSYQIPYETTHFVEISIRKVISTLLEAVLLVFLVMFLFLQNFRATLIPTLVVPVALLGTFAVMWLSGFSINMLTMFGMVLSIGILVDDAIVVVENVERIMMEEGLDARRATVKAMKQIGGAHGLFQRSCGEHLPAVCRNAHCVHILLRVSGPFPDSGAVRRHAETLLRGAPGEKGFFRMVQPDDTPVHGPVRPCRIRNDPPPCALPVPVCPHYCRGRLFVPYAAHLLPSGRRPGQLHGDGVPPCRHPSEGNQRAAAGSGGLPDAA